MSCRDTLRNDYGITSLRLFGSTARDDQRDSSDVDIFVETLTPNPFLLMEAKEYLDYFNQKTRVDLRPMYFR